MRVITVTLFLLLIVFFFDLKAEDAFQEFKIKRKDVFEFTKKPILQEEKNSTKILFAVKDFCDVTVAIENLEGKILRHLASGVLGAKAPEPFKKDSLEQSIIWDNKDDTGRYLDDKTSIKVRVSLGLQAEYEKDLYYSAYKRISAAPVMYAASEGVYVYEGMGRDHLRLYGHDGLYVKTIYPFPASQVKNVNGLRWGKAPDGHEIVEKESAYHQTLLTSGDNDSDKDMLGMTGIGATGLAVRDKRIALVFENLNRIATDGSTGGLPLKGPNTSISMSRVVAGIKQLIGPSSMAFSPDGKILYMTGYMWHQNSYVGGFPGSLQAVLKLNYESNEEMVVFAGVKTVEGFGSDDTHFSVPSSLDTDKSGNVYVSDFANDRVQIFEASGKLLKSLSVKYPAKVLVHQKTGEIYVFSWAVGGLPIELDRKVNYNPAKVPQKVFVFTPYPEMKLKQEDDFPMGPGDIDFIFSMGQIYQVVLDSWAEEPTIWVVGRNHIVQEGDYREDNLIGKNLRDPKLLEAGIRRIQLKNGKWETIGSFTANAKKDLLRITPPARNIQQLYFNHQLEKLYVGEADSGPTIKAFTELIEIDPVTNKTNLIKLPFNPQDIDFDINGLIYMRTQNMLGRYEMKTWKEVPFDYGEERSSVGKDGGIGGTSAPLVSGINLPAKGPVCYHQGGLSVNIKGDIAVACHYRTNEVKNEKSVGNKIAYTSEYRPMQYPGRLESGTSLCVHIWDKLGKLKSEDIVKGAPQTDGIFIDKDDNIFMLATPSRQIEGKPIDDGMSSTLIKFKNGSKGKFLTKEGSVPTPLNPTEFPKRPLDIAGQWVENAEWLYGGVGFAGFSANKAGGGCACWFVRFKLDYFGRSFVPAPMLYEVAVLDSEGNLILKIGKYGNEDSKGKNSKEPLGGDEVGLFHPCFVATHTDRRLFISDIGNENIMSVKLKYAVDEIVLLKK